MSIIWIVEKFSPDTPQAAQALIGNFAVRLFASLDSLAKLLGPSRRDQPQVLVIDLDHIDWSLARVQNFVDFNIPEVPCLLLSSSPLSFTFSKRYFILHKPLENHDFSRLVGHIMEPRGVAALRYRDVVLDLELFQCRVAQGEPQSLPLKEAQLLKLLMEKPGLCLAREEISQKLWGKTKVSERTIDSHVSRLRKRLIDAEVSIQSIYGGGYVLR